MKKCNFLYLFILSAGIIFSGFRVNAQDIWKRGKLRVAKNGHDLCFEDGYPFFWLGDTGRELFHRLTIPEIKLYLDNRASQGMNVIQAVVLAEFDGLRKPNRYGDIPFNHENTTQPNETYFKIIDSTIHLAFENGIFIGLLPTWGDKVTRNRGAGPVIFDSLKAYTYGKWIGNRNKTNPKYNLDIRRRQAG